MMHQLTDATPSLAESAALLTTPDALSDLAYYARGLRSRVEVAALLEHRAIDAIRAGDGYSAAHRYDLAAGQRELARRLRQWAAALRVVHEAER